MAGYLGNKQKISGRYTVDEFTSSGGTTYTLSSAPGAKNNIQVSAGGLVQYPSAYSVSGTTLTLTGVPSGQKVVVRHMGDTIPFPLLDDNVVTLAKMASGTDGNIITYDASGNPAAVATGTAGQVLTSAGVGAPPTFVTAAGGGAWTLIGTSVASASTTLDITGLDSTYDTYAIAISDIICSADAQNIGMRFGDSGGVDSASTDYGYHNIEQDMTVSAYTIFKGPGNTQLWLALDVGNVTNESFGGLYYLLTPGDSTAYPTLTGSSSFGKSTGNSSGYLTSGRRNAVITVDRVQLMVGTGTFTSGRMTVWGIKHT